MASFQAEAPTGRNFGVVMAKVDHVADTAAYSRSYSGTCEQN